MIKIHRTIEGYGKSECKIINRYLSFLFTLTMRIIDRNEEEVGDAYEDRCLSKMYKKLASIY